MESQLNFNIYSWLDHFNVQPEYRGKLIDIPNWIQIILSLIPESSRNIICQNNIYIDIPKLRSIGITLRRYIHNLDLPNLQKTNLPEYINLAKQAAIMQGYTPNTLILTIENQNIVDNPITDINPFLHQEIESCPEPIILILVKIVNMEGLRIKSSHVNALLVDKTKQTYELFEPYGKALSAVDNWFQTNFRLIARLFSYEYRPSFSLCPNLGPQYIAEKTESIPKYERGYCYTYTLMYIHMRLANLESTPFDVLKLLLSISSQQLRRYTIIYNNILHDYYNWPFR